MSLTPQELAVMEVVADFVIGSRWRGRFSWEEVRLKERLSQTVAVHAPQVRFILRLGLWLLEWGAWLRYGRCLTRLTEAKGHRWLVCWQASRWAWRRLLWRLVQSFVVTAYYSHPKVSAFLGFPEPSAESDPAPKLLPGMERPPTSASTLETEVCVIGSGAGGAVVAKELAQQGYQVLILEEGRFFDREDFSNLATLKRNQLLYRDSGFVATLGLPPILLPTARAVGGTTVINSGTCFRTPASVLQRWQRDFGVAHADSQTMEKYFLAVEKTLGVGPVPLGLWGGNNLVVDRGSSVLKLHGHALMRNAPECRGSGVCIFGCPTGAKQSMDRSYIPLALSHGARLITQMRAEKLVRKRDRIVALEVRVLDDQGRPGDRTLTVTAKIFIVACGALATPLLLKRSGLRSASGQIGKNLTIHPTAKAVGIFPETVAGFRGVPQGYGLEDYESEGLLFETVFFPPWLLATSLHVGAAQHAELMAAYQKIAIVGFLVSDTGRGRVTCGSQGRPLVWYSLGRQELEKFVKGVRILGHILFAAGAQQVIPTITSLGIWTDPSQVDAFEARSVKRLDIESAAFHPLGTCRMGADPRRSVVDINQRCHQFENLFVSDGSVFPTSLGVNPQMTIMAFAMRLADYLDAHVLKT